MSKVFLEYRHNLSYEKALHYQGVLNKEGYTGLLGFTCPATITLGRASSGTQEILVSHQILQDRAVDIVATDRGGKATFHGPGQFVGFPIVNLIKIYKDPRAVRRFNQELLLGLAHAFAGMGVRSAETRTGYPGVWTSRGKIASVGIAVKDGYIFHGFSINVTNECLSGFGLIQPCGIANCALTTLESEGVRIDNLEKFLRDLAPYLSNIFGEVSSEQSSTLKFDRKFDDIVAQISRSSAALDYLCSNLRASSLSEHNI